MDIVAVLVPEDPEVGLIVIQLAETEAFHEVDDVMFIDDDVAFGCVMFQVLQDVVGAVLVANVGIVRDNANRTAKNSEIAFFMIIPSC